MYSLNQNRTEMLLWQTEVIEDILNFCAEWIVPILLLKSTGLKKTY